MGHCQVSIPSPLLSYTKERHVVAAGATLGEVLQDLDRQYPGLRFRMVDEQDHVRPHMRVFVNGTQVTDLKRPLGPDATVHIVQALSGG
jgi:molybdopterin converting factor small subunit